MKRPWLTGLLSGAAVAAIMLTLGGALQAQSTPPASGRAAVVDVGNIFNEYQRYKDVSEELRQLEEELKLENEQRREKSDALEATINAMDREDPTYVKKLSEVLEARISHKTWFDLQQAHMAREIALATDRIYRDILRATASVAEAHGYDLALYRDEYVLLSSPEEAQAQMRARKVVYASDQIDITQTVLDRLNTDYRGAPHAPELKVP